MIDKETVKTVKKNRSVRAIAGFLIAMLLVTNVLPNLSFANKQNPLRRLVVERITSSIIKNPFTSKNSVIPDLKLTWEADTPSLEEDKTSDAVDGSGLHNPNRYEVYSQNVTASEKEALLTSTTALTYSTTRLNTGSIYKFKVLPVHDHTYGISPNERTQKAPYTDATHPKVAVLTDLAVDVVTEGRKIIVTFDDPGTLVDFDLYYEQGDVTDFGPTAGRVQLIRADSKRVLDPSTRRSRLEYTLEHDSIKAGQIYSVGVKPVVGQIDGTDILFNQKVNIQTCTTEIPFAITEDSDGYLRLNWWGIDSSIGIGGSTTQYDVKELRIVERNEETKIERIISTLIGKNAIQMGYYLAVKPKVTTSYKIVIVYNRIASGGTEEVKEMESRWISYDPSSLRIIPQKPEIPNVGSKLSTDDNSVLDLNKYQGTFRYDLTTKLLNLVWSTFERKDYVGNQNTNIIDLDTYYDILITDDVNALSDLELNTELDYYVGKQGSSSLFVLNKSGKKVGYFKEYSQYLGANYDNGLFIGYALKEFESNKVYYVRVIAKKKILGEELRSIPSIMPIYIDAAGNMAVPPTLPKPPLKEKEITDKSFSVEWRKDWYEVAPIDSNGDWASRVWIYNQDISFVKIDGSEEIELTSQNQVNILKSKLSSTNASKYVFRNMNLDSKTKYEVYYTKNATVENEIKIKKLTNPFYTIKEYVYDFINKKENDLLWKEITPLVDPNDTSNHTVFTKVEGLESNTNYYFMIRAYKVLEDGTKVYNTYPSSLIITTLLPGTEIEPVPTVPRLFLDSIQDIKANIGWKANPLLSYEIRYSKKEDISTATSIKVTPQDLKNITKQGENYILELFDLFPKTEYYVWIKAMQTKGKLESAWSNPLTIVTKDIQPDPLNPPTGIGVASVTSPIGKEYITIEWVRTQDDLSLDSYQGKKVKKQYSYILEIADNIKFLDSKKVEISADKKISTKDFEIISNTIVKAKDLKANIRYYIRMKSKITVSESDQSGVLTKESTWSLIKIIKTLADAEYDADIGEIEIPLPEKDEKVYNGDTVTYNIINDEKAIDDLIKRNLFDYTVDFSNEASKITRRMINLKENVVLSMARNDVDLLIKLSDMEISIPGKALLTAEYKKLVKSGGVDLITVAISDNYIFTSGEYNNTKEIGLTFKNKYGTLESKYLENYMDISWYKNGLLYLGLSQRPYVYDEVKKIWTALKDYYSLSDRVIFKSGMLGKFTIK